MGTGRGKVSVMNKHSSRIAIAGVSHHTANVMALESFRFPDEPAFLAAAKKRFGGVSFFKLATGSRSLSKATRIHYGIFLKARSGRISSFLKAARRCTTFSHSLPVSNQ